MQKRIIEFCSHGRISKRISLFGLIIIINLFLYYPSFFDSCRGSDHQIFLSDISRIETLPGLISQSYSYTRTQAGDMLLFRPLLYILLAFEKWLFGYDFFWWQVTGFILHLLVQWALFKILNLFLPSRWSFLVVLLNSVLFLQQEMVSRTHFSGYLLFQIFCFTAIYQFFKYCQGPSPREKHFIRALAWLTLACFAYEGALIINGLFIAFLFIPWKKAFDRIPARHKVMIWLPMLIYFGVSATDFFLRVKNFSYAKQGLTGSVQLGSFDAGIFLANMANMVKIAFQGFLFPAFTKLKFIGDQYHYDTFSWVVDSIPKELNAGLVVFCSALLVFSLWTVIRNKAAMKSFWDPKVFIFGLIMLSYILAYMGLFCLTRLQTNPGYLNTVAHHFYIIYSFALIALCCIAFPFLMFIDRYRPGIKRALFIALIAFSFLQGYFLHQLNNEHRSRWEPQRIYLKRIERFVKQHKKEPDFSFAIFKSELIYMYPGRKTLVDMLFPGYISSHSPKYYVVYTKKEGVGFFSNGADANQYVQEMINKNGPWKKDFYISGSKIDLQALFLRLKLLTFLMGK